MSLEPGSTVGSYAVTGHLGTGGMGEVYRARDTKLDRDVALKVLPAERDNLPPSWTPDGQQLTYLSNADGAYSYYVAPFDGSRAPDAHFSDPLGRCCFRAAWSPDREHLVYTHEGSGLDVWILSRDQAPAPLIAGPANELRPAFSPDGRYLLYESDESGQVEIHLRPFPDIESGRLLISESGGTRPKWSRGGREILYATPEGVMQVPLSYDDGEPAGLTAGRATMLVELEGIVRFDVSADGERLAFERQPVETAAREIRVVLNWFEELRRLVPVE